MACWSSGSAIAAEGLMHMWVNACRKTGAKLLAAQESAAVMLLARMIRDEPS